MNPARLPADRYLNLVYFWLVDGVDERRRREIDAELDRHDDEGVWSAEAEMAAFSAAAAAVG